MHAIVCGGREYIPSDADYAWLDTFGLTRVYSGGSTGADKAGERWAQWRKVPLVYIEADWKLHGRAAGPIRNAQMLVELAKADVGTEIAVIAFPGGRGTADMVRRARRAAIRVIERELT